MTTLNITLEWFLNPDHLPMIAGIQTGAYANAGLMVNMTAPDDHYDGFDELQTGAIDIHVNEPLHLFEHYSPNLRALGTFFETDGGILMKADRMNKLHTPHQKIRITTPVAEPKTDRIGFEILKRHAKQHGVELSFDDVVFVQNDFYHINHLLADDTLDGAWLCFYNFEAIEARHRGLDFEFIDQHRSPYANFSALEFITTDKILADKGEAIGKFLQITRQMVAHCQDNPELAKRYYYEYTATEPDELTDGIIMDTLPRLDKDIIADGKRWQAVREMLDEIDIISLTDDEYQTLWSVS